MKLKSAAGYNCYVKNVQKSVAFYEMLGFQPDKGDDRHASVRLNWFWIDFIAQDKETRDAFQHEVTATDRGAGILMYLSVDDVKEAYQELLTQGVQPESEPYDWAGNREFVIRDPDGYRLVIFKRKK